MEGSGTHPDVARPQRSLDPTLTGRELDAEYRFNRPLCLFFTAFSVALVVAGVVIAVTAGDQMFADGFVPGWLFGSVVAAMFSMVGVSWARRLAYPGPGLVLGDSGITGYKFVGTIPWEEIESASPGKGGAVILRLRDVEAFRARQSLKFRLAAWDPRPHLRSTVIIESRDLATDAHDLFTAIHARVKRGRLEDPADRLVEPEAAIRPAEE